MPLTRLTRLSDEGRRRALGAGGERGIPVADRARVPHGRAREVERGRVRVGARADVVPVEDVLAERGVPARGRRRERRRREAVGRRMRVGVERRSRIARVARPPADGDLLGVHRVAHDEVVRGRLGGPAGEEVHGEVERAPPGVDRRRAAAVGRAERREHERGPGRGGEVRRDLRGVVGRVLVVLVERRRPRRLLRREVDLDTARELGDGREHLARDLGDRPVRRQRDAPRRARRCARRRPRARAGRARRRARPSRRAPAAAASPSRARVRRSAACCSCGSGGAERGGELAEDLRVRVQRVAGRAPGVVGSRATRSSRLHLARRCDPGYLVDVAPGSERGAGEREHGVQATRTAPPPAGEADGLSVRPMRRPRRGPARSGRRRGRRRRGGSRRRSPRRAGR